MASPPNPSRPRLVRADEPPPGPGAPGSWRAEGGGRDPVRLALVLALIAALVWGVVETRWAEDLEEQVTALTTELAEARQQVERHRRHLDDIRVGVADLESRVAELRGLAERDPAPPTAGR
jgi:hypothetical protein